MITFYILIFIFGLVIGSFLNVVIFRLETSDKIINDRSKCLYCDHRLSWYDLVPVLSFLFLKGKCRYCGKKISFQYPIVEITTGLLFVLVCCYFPFVSNISLLIKWLFLFYILSALIIVFFYDLKHFIIPDKIIFPAVIVALIYNLISDFISSSGAKFDYFFINNSINSQLYLFLLGSQFFNTFIAALVGFLFLFLILLMTKGKGMGGGDVKLAFLMGLVLGWPVLLLAMLMSFILGSIYGIPLIILGRKKMNSMVPFGPFLVMGTFIALFWGNEIISWYIQTFFI
ncbi:prepilin peptidase [Candidatus Parcubacteria bacterium]|nr:prepilin peptidase [Candidatus Parcubacteria bacterium]